MADRILSEEADIREGHFPRTFEEWLAQEKPEINRIISSNDPLSMTVKEARKLVELYRIGYEARDGEVAYLMQKRSKACSDRRHLRSAIKLLHKQAARNRARIEELEKLVSLAEEIVAKGKI